jgi:hypothetical protein
VKQAQTIRRQSVTGLRRALPTTIIGLVLLALAPLTSPTFAQSPSPTPPTAGPSWEAGMPSAQMSELLDHVRKLVPYLRRQIERPLLKKFEILAMILGSLVLLFSFVRTIRENDGASQELYYWFGRAVIFMTFFAIAPSMISTLYKIGRTLTIPIEGQIEEKRVAFNDAYYEFVHGTFIVKDEKQIIIDPIYLKPGQEGWVGVLTDQEAGDGKLNGIKAMEKATDLTSWSMPKLFFGLNVSRGILQAGEIFLLLLGGFVMVGLRLAAPFMVAVGIDKKLAERITYPYLWGTVVFTLIFPIVRDILTYIAYTAGSFGLMLYKGQAIYTIDEKTAELIKTNPYDPTLVIIMTLVIMTITGLMLWLSPYLAYRIATGQIFEAVSSTASGWMAAIIGSAIEFTGLKAGASLQRQAENTQTQGAYQAELTRAKGTLEVSNLGAQARKVSALANIEGSRQAALGAIFGNAATARGMAQTTQNFTIAAARAQVGDSNRQLFSRADQAIRQTGISQSSESIRIAGESYARKEEIVGKYMTAIPYVGVIPSAEQDGFANTDRTRTNNAANNWFAYRTQQNEMRTAQEVSLSQHLYQSNIEGAAREQYEGNVAAINEGAGIAAGGANRGASISAGGVNKAYGLEIEGNKIQFNTTNTAASQIKDANLEASRMRELSTVISGMARDMDRRIEEGMRQRY